MNFRSYQHLVLVGRLGRDARVSQTKSGVEMLSFSVATTESLKNSDGSFEQRTSWHDCLLFGTRSPKLAFMMIKGTLVCVQAHLSYRTLTVGDKQHQVATIIVDDLQLLAGPAAPTSETVAAGDATPRAQATAPAAAHAQPAARQTYARARRAPASAPAQAQTQSTADSQPDFV